MEAGPHTALVLPLSMKWGTIADVDIKAIVDLSNSGTGIPHASTTIMEVDAVNYLGWDGETRVPQAGVIRTMGRHHFILFLRIAIAGLLAMALLAIIPGTEREITRELALNGCIEDRETRASLSNVELRIYNSPQSTTSAYVILTTTDSTGCFQGTGHFWALHQPTLLKEMLGTWRRDVVRVVGLDVMTPDNEYARVSLDLRDFAIHNGNVDLGTIKAERQ